MSIANYADVLTSIRDWLARPTDTVTLPDARLGDLVQFAEAEIWDRLRTRDMLASTALTINAQSISAPADLIEVSRLYLDGTPIYPLTYAAPPQFWQTFSANIAGRPRAFTVEGGAMLFGPNPDASYTGRLLYYARPAALSAATNAVFSARPNLWLYGALAHAAPLIGNDGRIATWRGMFEAGLKQAQDASDRAAYGGAPLTIGLG
jgi:hypothetical protein